MGLKDGYGVVIGTKHDYYRDPPDDYGRYYHGNLILKTDKENYHCAIDVDPKFMPDGIEWRVVEINPNDLKTLTALSDGWHSLQANSSSGALDYMRSEILSPPHLVQKVQTRTLLSFVVNILPINIPWNNGTGIEALTDLEILIEKGVRFYVFGEPFSSGFGVHNVHQNQGDPVGGGHDGENAIWQDGATLVQTADNRIFAFLNKFKTQAYETDELGHPLG